MSLVLISGTIFCQTGSNDELSSPGEKQMKTSDSYSIEEKCNDIKLSVESNKKKIESLYFKDEEVYVAYGGGTEIITREYKKHIYRAGEKLLEVNNEKLNSLSPTDYDGRLTYLKEINKIQDQLLYFISIDKTRSIEKKLKKLKTPEEIYPVFFTELK